MKTLLSVLGLLAAATANAARVVSVNVSYLASDRMSAQSGTDNSLAGDGIPCSSWTDLTATSGSMSGLPVWTGTNVKHKASLSLSWSVNNIWGTGSSPCVFRRGWITATSHGAWTMTFSNVPFAAYDVICYFNWDGSHGFSPVSINGTSWTWGDGKAVVGSSDWGTETCDLNDAAAFGKNALIVTNQCGSTLEIGSQAYGNVCAVQIVERGEPGDETGDDDESQGDPAEAQPLPSGLVSVTYDRMGRSWWLSLDSSRSASVSEWKVTYPNPDGGSVRTNETATLANSAAFPNDIFRRRFPEGEGPWTVSVRVTLAGADYAGDLVVRRPTDTVAAPTPNGEILVGVVGYSTTEADSSPGGFVQNPSDLLYDVMENDLCNFCISWYGISMLLPANWPVSRRESWLQRIRNGTFSAKSIYSGDDRSTQAKAERAFGGRYWGNNVGEMASFIYQSYREMQANLDLQLARDTFVNRFVGSKTSLGTRVGSYDFPMTFSTCGAALSCYELAGGIDFICNELWAIGAQNIGYASAEARGAARKWKPEYWGGWNAHDWQTTRIPYRTDQKFYSLLVSYFQEYIAGTSMIILESGAQGGQAFQYTSAYEGQSTSERAAEGYAGETATRYRRMVKRFYEWTKAHPRGDATPETKIAIALGNLDGYIGENGSYTVWAQHDNSGNANWRYGAPENTQALVEDVFYPRPAALTAPYENTWIGGSPYGQADVMQIDDDVTLSDLSRYSLLVFGGWNTMTDHLRDVLERYVEQGGTLVMSRPELTTRVDREHANYTDADLNPLFGELPAAGAADEAVESVHGRGRYVLFTARAFPGASDAGKAAYAAKVRELAAAVAQSATIRADADADRDAVYYGVYPDTAYFLNADTVAEHAFTYALDGVTNSLTLKPREIVAIDRKTQTVARTDNTWDDAGASDSAAAAEATPETLGGNEDHELDLDGQSRYVAGWDSTVTWDAHHLAVSNGTLLVSGSVATRGYTTEVGSAGRMVFQIGSTIEAASMSGEPFRQIVRDGGELVLNGDLRLYNYRLTVESGGRATLAPTWVETVYTTHQGSVFENAGGTLSVSGGLQVSTESSGSGGTVTLRQSSGTLELGGTVEKAAGTETFALDLADGTVKFVAPTVIAVDAVTLGPSVGFSVDLDKFKSGGTLLTSTNAALVAKVNADVAAQIAGTDYSLTEADGVLTLVAAATPDDPTEDDPTEDDPTEDDPSGDDPGGAVTEVTSLQVDDTGHIRIGIRVKLAEDLNDPEWHDVTIENPTLSDDGKTLAIEVPTGGTRGFYRLLSSDSSK